MGLFGLRKASSREPAAASQPTPFTTQETAAPGNVKSRLATLFSEPADDDVEQTNSLDRYGDELRVPAIDIQELETSDPVPADTVTPIAANQFEDDDRSFAVQGRKSAGRLQQGTSTMKSQQATGLQEIAVQRAESLSRIARRNSIKRSVSRKIARSESRRQLLNIRSGTLSEEKGNPTLPRLMASAASSHDSERRDSPVGNLSRSLSPLNEGKQAAKASPSPTSGMVPSSVEGQLKGLDISRGVQGQDTFDSKEKVVPANLLLEEEESVLLHDDIDDDLELSHSSLRSFECNRTGRDPSTKERKRETTTSSTSQSRRRREVGSSRERNNGKQRRRPPPLVGSDETQSTPNSAMDWPSGGCFGSDGGFMTGGFKITTEGMVGKPHGMKREDSDSEMDGDVPQSSRNLVIVKSLKEFRAGPTIGAGAGGRVYIAQHMPSKKTMAMKVVNVYDKEKRNQLLKELETLSMHVSRYLVRFYGAFYDGSGAVHIALEYMDHGCLSTFVQRAGAIPERIVQMIALDCLKGLKFLHRHHVLHRDFKTANILLSRKLCCAKLSDFGLARDLNPGVSKVDTFVGTVAYMSPERLQGSKYTYASDIWALGVCIVECLLGRYPFDRPQNYFDYIEATLTANMLHGFDQKGARFSPEVRDFVSLCTMTDPMRRPASNQLLEHPWLRTVKRDTAAFGAWLDECRILSMLSGPATGKR